MPPVTPPTITALPTPPTRSDPASFAERGDAFLGALPTFGTQLNAAAGNAYANAVDAAGSAAGAETARDLAQDAQGAAQLAVQQTLAGTAVPMWAPGTYAQGALAWSPSTRWTYRRHAATGTSAVDPAAEPGAWALAAPADLPVLTVGSATVTMAPGARYSLTHNAAVVATLPASPQVGSVVAVVASNLRRDNTVARNGQLIEGLAEDLVLNRLGAAIGLAFVGGATGWKIVRFDTLDRSFPFPIDAQGRVLANVAHRTGTLASLKQLAGSAGEVTVATDAAAVVLHNGTAGQARAVVAGGLGELLLEASCETNGRPVPGNGTAYALTNWVERADPLAIFNATTGQLSMAVEQLQRYRALHVQYYVQFMERGGVGTYRMLTFPFGTLVVLSSPDALAGAPLPRRGMATYFLDSNAGFDGTSAWAPVAGAVSGFFQAEQDGAINIDVQVRVRIFGEPV